MPQREVNFIVGDFELGNESPDRQMTLSSIVRQPDVCVEINLLHPLTSTITQFSRGG